MSSFKDKILQFQDCQVEPFEIPEWDCVAYLRQWSAAERGKFMKTSLDMQKSPGLAEELYPKIVVWSLCEEDGELLFCENDLPALKKKNGAVIQRIGDAALKFNGLAPDSVDDAKKN